MTDSSSDTIRVRVFSLLRPFLRQRELGHDFDWPLAENPTDGHRLAEALGLPPERIEGMFVNHTMRSLDAEVRAGDEVAFVPYGTPGPHRVYLGIYGAGRSERAD